MLPTVDFCGLQLTRLLIGANPFGGFSHQNKQRDQEMVTWSTPERIRETWARAWDAGINAMVTNNETPHVIGTTTAYLAEGGPLQWVAQLNNRTFGSMEAAIDRAVEIGCRAAYLHGGYTDHVFAEQDADALRRAIRHGQSLGIPMGVAGHSPEAHLWVDSLDLVDFHTVCFFNCGSLHSGKGERFQLADVWRAVDAIQRIQKPCIAYKVLGAGRIDARMGLEFAYDHIKPGDVINLGMHRGDKDGMVEENVALVREILAEPVPA
jgi:hypothetical protein